jgi:hypothetical protein
MTPARFVLIATLVLALADDARADNDAASRALYNPASIFGFFTPEMKAELKVTKDQEKALKANEPKQHKIWDAHIAAEGQVRKAKLPKREETAKLRALETKVDDELFAALGEALRPEQVERMKQIILQIKGMELFDYPEIRDALKIGDKDVKLMKAAYDKLAHEERKKLDSAIQAKQMTREQAAKRASNFRFSVPDNVRESLSPAQKKTLEDLLGEKYNYK